MWILPTMSRPVQCAEVMRRMREMACSTGGVLFLNGSESLVDYFKETEFTLPNRSWRTFVSKKNMGALGAMNKVLREYPNERFYGFVGDDEFVETPVFDRKLVEAAGDWNISHGDDGAQGGKRAHSYLCIGGKLAHAVGYLAIASCWHWFGLDNMWEELAKEGACQKIFCKEVRVDHRHPYLKKGDNDACYDLGSSRIAEDHYEFSKWMHLEKDKTIIRVLKAKQNA